MQEQITNCVHALRSQQKITQEELSLALGVSRQTIIAIEKGNYTPSVYLALKISKHFKQPIEKIFKLA